MKVVSEGDVFSQIGDGFNFASASADPKRPVDSSIIFVKS